MSLRVTQLKPNPAGRDLWYLGGTSPSQLAGEWVDIRNDGSNPADMGPVRLFHRAYVGQTSEWQWAPVVTDDAAIAGVINAGQTLRIHSGRVRDNSVIRVEDMRGADFHLFTGRDAYIWNNDRTDAAGIWNVGQKYWVDQAEYSANPPEGVILIRSGHLLIPSGRANPASLAALAALGARR